MQDFLFTIAYIVLGLGVYFLVMAEKHYEERSELDLKMAQARTPEEVAPLADQYRRFAQEEARRHALGTKLSVAGFLIFLVCNINQMLSG